MKKKWSYHKGLTLACTLTLAWTASLVQAEPVTGASFLKIPVGARAIGMGEAFTSLAEGAEALNWNVAGISQPGASGRLEKGGLSFSHVSHFNEASLDNFNLAMPLGTFNDGLFAGISATRFSYPTQERRTSERESKGSFGAEDLMVGAALANNFGAFQLGGQVKLIRLNVAGKTAQGMAADLGLGIRSPARRLSFGAAVRNLGPDMKFIDQSFKLPLMVSAGAAFQFVKPLALALDVHAKPHQEQVSVAVGTEFTPVSMVVLRTGYLAKLASAISNTQENETNQGQLSGFNGLTGGLGIHGTAFSLDYAFTPMGELGNNQTLTLSVSF